MPRQPLRGEPADHVVSFRLTESELRFVVRVARVNAMSIGELLSEAVNEYAAELGEQRQFPRSLTVCQSIITRAN